MALTVANKTYIPLGNYNLVVCKVTGDGSTTTYESGLTTILVAWCVDIDDSPTDNLVTWSGGTITFANAISNTKKRWLFIIGN